MAQSLHPATPATSRTCAGGRSNGFHRVSGPKIRLLQRIQLFAFLLAALVLLAGCGSGALMSEPAANQEFQDSTEAKAYDGDEGLAAMPAEEYGKQSGGDLNQPPSAPEALGRKIIRDGNVEMETLTFEDTVNGLYKLVEDKGGFIESQSIRGGRYNYSSLRYAEIVLRVPAQSFDEVMHAVEALGTVVQTNSNGTDITDQYADTESRVRNLKVQETRILELIAKAEKLEEIVTLEARLSELRYQIESYENALRNYDRLLTFSRISMRISEVQRVTEVQPVPKTLGERISQAFDRAWTGFLTGSQDFAVWVVESMFGLILLAILLLILWLIVRAARRKRRKEKEVWMAMHPQPSHAQPMGYPQPRQPAGTVMHPEMEPQTDSNRGATGGTPHVMPVDVEKKENDTTSKT